MAYQGVSDNPFVAGASKNSSFHQAGLKKIPKMFIGQENRKNVLLEKEKDIDGKSNYCFSNFLRLKKLIDLQILCTPKY